MADLNQNREKHAPSGSPLRAVQVCLEGWKQPSASFLGIEYYYMTSVKKRRKSGRARTREEKHVAATKKKNVLKSMSTGA